MTHKKPKDESLIDIWREEQQRRTQIAITCLKRKMNGLDLNNSYGEAMLWKLGRLQAVAEAWRR